MFHAWTEATWRTRVVLFDAHSNFLHPGNSDAVGAAAGEELAIVTGRGDTRYLGLVPMKNIIDRRNAQTILHCRHWDDKDPVEKLAKIDTANLAKIIADQIN